MVIGRNPRLEDCEGAPTPKAPARPASGFLVGSELQRKIGQTYPDRLCKMKWARLDSRLILSFQLQYLDCIADVNYHGQILAMDIKDVTGVGERIVQSPRMVGTGWIRCFKLWVWITTFVHPPPLDITHTHQLWERSELGKHWGPGHEVCIIKLLRFKDLTQTSAS